MSNIYGFLLSNQAVKARNLVRIESLNAQSYLYLHFLISHFDNGKTFKVQGKKVDKV
jgi:hypothetical protein